MFGKDSGCVDGGLSAKRLYDRLVLLQQAISGDDRSTANMPDSLSDLARDLDRFAADRDWHKYHAPKNVASALIVEAGELLEHFQWMTEEESRNLSPEKLAEVRAEMADVLLYLVQLGNVLDVDVVAAGREKLAVNARRFPIR